MNLKLTPLLTWGLLLTLSVNGQLTSTMTVENNLCNGDSTGSVTLSGIEACFAPVEVAFDTFAPFYVPTLKNDGYKTLNHGSGTGNQGVLGVTSASTSVGDVYIAAGYFADSITFETTTLYDNGTRSMFVACFETATGDLLWADAASAGGTTYVQAFGATIIGDKAFVVGYLKGTTVFGSATVVSTGGYQGFIAKYDIPTGGLDTVLQVGNAGDEECTNIHAGDDDRLYVTGDFTGSVNLAGSTFTASGSSDAFVTCFETTLSQNYWAATGGGTGIEICADVTTY